VYRLPFSCHVISDSLIAVTPLLQLLLVLLAWKLLPRLLQVLLAGNLLFRLLQMLLAGKLLLRLQQVLLAGKLLLLPLQVLDLSQSCRAADLDRKLFPVRHLSLCFQKHSLIDFQVVVVEAALDCLH
jgi:hypothetical protein